MNKIIGTKKEFESWNFDFSDSEISELPMHTELIFFDDGYWYMENDSNDPIDKDYTGNGWLEYVDVPAEKILEA